MPTIEIETYIKSDIKICFDLSRSIDLHQISTAQSKEKAVDGVKSGLIKLGEYVTWQANHLGFRQRLSSKITAYDNPFHFRDEQIKGPFKFIIHDHYFEKQGDGVKMKDVFKFQSPLGILGKLVDKTILTRYLTNLLIKRNIVIKEFAETKKWKSILNG